MARDLCGWFSGEMKKNARQSVGWFKKCNSNGYIRVIEVVEDYYGVYKIIAFDVWPVSSGNEVTINFLEVACSFEKNWNMQKMRCWELFFSNNLFVMYYFLMFIVCYHLLFLFVHCLSNTALVIGHNNC